MQIGCGLWASLIPHSNKIIINIISTGIYLTFYLLAVKASFGKTIFTLLMLSNIANFITVSSKCIEGQIFPELAAETYQWSYCVVTFTIQLLILIPLFFYIKKTYTNAIEKEHIRSAWKYLWMIPSTFYVMWFYHLYNTTNSSVEIALQIKNTIFLLIMNLGAFFIYHTVVCLINEYDKNYSLETKNNILVLQNIQYENLKDRIAETRRAKHDLRHHMTIINSYLQQGELDKLSDYLENYNSSIPDDNSVILCQNITVNLLLLYFLQQAKNNNIEIEIHIDIPEKINIAEYDLTVLIGNILENAIEACSNKSCGSRWIKICGKVNNNTLLFTVDNTYEGKIILDKNGNYLSSKHSGSGVGIESIKQIASKYDGIFQINQEKGVFCLSLMLNIPENNIRD